MSTSNRDAWLLLIHQIPPKPDYLRVKTWRRLQRIGAVSIKNSVYVLPSTDAAREDFEWVLREIADDGGEGSVCEAKFVDGLADDEVKALFHAARDPDYEAIAADARALDRQLRSRKSDSPDAAKTLKRDVDRLRKRLSDIASVDFFGAPAGETAEALVSSIEQEVAARFTTKTRRASGRDVPTPNAATWVTRKGIHVDRMASAWLIKRFIDPAARFKFVSAKGYRVQPGELRFDMFEAEYTHEGDSCTFEVLIARFGLAEPGLVALAEIVHDIDLKDGKFGRDETPGVDRLIAGIAMANKDDDTRLIASTAVWDGLYEYYRRKGS